MKEFLINKVKLDEENIIDIVFNYWFNNSDIHYRIQDLWYNKMIWIILDCWALYTRGFAC